MTPCPEASGDLDFTEFEDGLLVYRSHRERVHYLNATVAFVFKLCDGHRTVTEISEILRKAWNLSAPPEGEIDEMLKLMMEEGLLAHGATRQTTGGPEKNASDDGLQGKAQQRESHPVKTLELPAFTPR